MTNRRPTPKVAAAALGGAVSVVVVWALGFAVEVPATVASAFTTICTAAVGYFTPDDIEPGLGDDEGQSTLVWLLAIVGVVLLILILFGDEVRGR